MFKYGTLKERYDLSLLICKKTRKVAKIFGFIYLFVIGLITIVAVFASISGSGEQLNVGMLLLVLAGFPVGYISGHILGSAISWTYYWFELKFNMDSPFILAIILPMYVGIPVWLKYRQHYKKLAKK
jgi:hypothetical protein